MRPTHHCDQSFARRLTADRRPIRRLGFFLAALLSMGVVTATFFYNRARGATTYTWNQTGTASWATAGNWSPTRTTPAIDDILVFNNGATTTVTNVPTQTIGQLTVSGNTTVNLQAAAAVTLTIAGGTGTDLDVQSGSALNCNTTNAITIAVGTGATGSIGGSMTFSSSASTTHSLTAADASGLTFNSGSVFTQGTNNTGSVFGSGTSNSVIFASGSTFIQKAGANPFQKTQPASVVVFQTGSLYSFQASLAPSLSGRTYANLEINSAAFNQSGSGAATLSVDNLTITAGTLNLGMTGSFNLKGNVSVGSAATLNFNPASAATVAFNGSNAQTISNSGTLTFQSNQNVTINNSNGVTLNNSITLNGVATLTSGNITTGSNTLTLGSSASISGGSTSSYVIGNLKKTAVPNGSFTFPVGTNNGYTPVDLANSTGGGDLTVTPKTPQQPMLASGTSLQEYWTLTRVGTLTTDLTFNYLQVDVTGNEGNYRVIVVESGNATSFPADGVNVFIDTVNNKFTRKAVQSFSDWTVAEPVSPTAVKLIGFSATRNDNDVMLQWQSGYEVRNLGYNIYREQNGSRTLITHSPVAGSALLAGRQTELTAGLSYTWFDHLAENKEERAESSGQMADGSRQTAGNGGVTYWLEDVDLDGTRTLHGPIAPAVVATKTKEAGERSPLLGEVRLSIAEAGVRFDSWPAVRQTSVCRDGAKGSGCDGQRSAEANRTQPATALDDQRVIAATPGVKLAISKAGWYRITQPELVTAGLAANVNAAQIQLFADAQQVPIKVSGNGVQLASSDYVEFYGHGLNSTTDAKQTYYLIAGNSAGLRISTLVDNNPLPIPSGPSGFDYTVERKERSIYFSGLLNGDAENFFGPIVNGMPASQTVPASQLDQSAGTPARLEVALQGVTSGSHTVRVLFNSADIGAITFANTDHPVRTLSVPAAALLNGDNTVQLTALGGSGDISLIDTLRLTYAHTYVAENDALSLGINGGGTTRISGFTTANVRAADITDPANVQELTPLVTAQPDGTYTADLRVAAASVAQPHTLLVFADATAAHPDTITHNYPSTWNANTNNADYLIITTAGLAASVEPLAALRRSRGMQVSVVDVEDLYDEFSFGRHSPQALHDFLQLAASTWRRAPHYVLLAGDSSYDPKNYFGRGLNDLVPTKLIDTTQTETASDDWLADFDGDGVADLAIGRLPVRTSAETATVVSKIISYENTPIDPQRGALLVADRTFEAASISLQSALPANLPVQTINRGSGDDPTIHNQIVSSINQGPRVTNYFGHGSNGVWTSAFLLSSLDAPLLTNTNNLSVFTMMTCYNGYFQDALNDSLSEALLKSPGGAVAVWASTSLTEPGGQSVIDREFYRQTLGAQAATLGDAVRSAKLTTGDPDVRRTWTLFGDPAMRLLSVSPTATSGTLSGTITDSNGAPLAGTTISLSGAQTRQTITDGNGNYSFDDLETNGLYTVTPARANYTFSPASRSFSLLWALTEASFTGLANGVILNPLDTTEFFVRQQYLDLLGREPDESGFNFWSNQVQSCGNDPTCLGARRINTSAAFFLSIEFQQTGYEVYRMYKAAYGDLPNAPVPLKFGEFLPDTRKLGHGVVVGQSGWEQALEGNKQAFADEFVLRSRFAGLYGSMADARFVDALNQNAGGALTQSERDQLIQDLSSRRKTRAQVLRSVAENAALTRAEFNKAFVLMEYFGYLRRGPNQGPDTDFAGYNFWLNKLDHFDGNFVNAEMVKAFLVSREYLQRFGP